MFTCYTDDDSDGDLVTDYLCLASNKDGSETKAININKPPKSTSTSSAAYEHNKMHNNNNINNINMVPTISVTPHSPGTKYNSILGKNYIRDKSVCRIFFENYRFFLTQRIR